MNLATFKSGGKATIAGFVNSLYGSEGSDPVAAWVRQNCRAKRPVVATDPDLWPDYGALVTAVNTQGPTITQSDLDAAIGAWSGTFP